MGYETKPIYFAIFYNKSVILLSCDLLFKALYFKSEKSNPCDKQIQKIIFLSSIVF